MNKKIIIGIIAAIVVIGGTVGTVLGVQAHQTNKEYEALSQSLTECTKMIQNTNYVYAPENDESKQARQTELDKVKTFEEKVKTKKMSDEEKKQLSEFVNSVKKHYEDDKNETKNQLDAVQASKDSHSEEGYYSDEFNNEWNGLVNQFNETYNKGEYFNAFQVVLTMQNKLNEYVANKEQEAQARAQAEAEQAAAAAQVKNSASKSSGSKSSSSSSGKKSSGSSTSASAGNGDGAEENAGGEDTGYRGYSSYEEWYAKAPSWEEGSFRNQNLRGQQMSQEEIRDWYISHGYTTVGQH